MSSKRERAAGDEEVAEMVRRQGTAALRRISWRMRLSEPFSGYYGFLQGCRGDIMAGPVYVAVKEREAK